MGPSFSSGNPAPWPLVSVPAKSWCLLNTWGFLYAYCPSLESSSLLLFISSTYLLSLSFTSLPPESLPSDPQIGSDPPIVDFRNILLFSFQLPIPVFPTRPSAFSLLVVRNAKFWRSIHGDSAKADPLKREVVSYHSSVQNFERLHNILR